MKDFLSLLAASSRAREPRLFVLVEARKDGRDVAGFLRGLKP